MALDDNRIPFVVDVSTGQSEESINKVIGRIDGLKDKINELKKLRTENKQDADIFANYTKSIRDTERELSKLQSTYNSWIQKYISCHRLLLSYSLIHFLLGVVLGLHFRPLYSILDCRIIYIRLQLLSK